MPPYERHTWTGSSDLDTLWAGIFWLVLNVSLAWIVYVNGNSNSNGDGNSNGNGNTNSNGNGNNNSNGN